MSTPHTSTPHASTPSLGTQRAISHGRVGVTSPRSRLSIAGAAVGNFVEWYDFSVYAFFATTIGALFFPSTNHAISLLSTYATFGVAFVMRPVGAVIFGHYADRLGRKRSLVILLALISLATTFIGVLPTHAAVGALAPVLLVAARAFQGLSAGGEYASASSYIVEQAPDEHRGRHGSWTYVSVGMGLLAGAALGLLLSSILSTDQLQTWGWRLPFLLAAPLGLVVLFVRLRLEDSPEFEQARSEGKLAKSPVTHALATQWSSLLRAVGLVIVGTVGVYLVLLYMPAYYVTVLQVSPTKALAADLVGLAAFVLLTPVVGRLSDRYGRKPFLIACAVAPLALVFPMFALMKTGYAGIVVAQTVLSLTVAVWAGSVPTTLVELFPTAVRASALGLSYSVTVAVFGGFAPTIVTAAYSATGTRYAPAYLLGLAAVITAVTAFIVRETAPGRSGISRSHPTDPPSENTVGRGTGRSRAAETLPPPDTTLGGHRA